MAHLRFDWVGAKPWPQLRHPMVSEGKYSQFVREPKQLRLRFPGITGSSGFSVCVQFVEHNRQSGFGSK